MRGTSLLECHIKTATVLFGILTFYLHGVSCYVYRTVRRYVSLLSLDSILLFIYRDE